MDDSNNFNQDAASRFWDNYINTLVEQDVTEKVRRWYVKRVEQYIKHYPDDRLRTHSARHVEAFFTEMGREGQLSDWHNGNLSMLYGFFFAVCFNQSSVRRWTGDTGSTLPNA